jgi:thymidine kinase
LDRNDNIEFVIQEHIKKNGKLDCVLVDEVQFLLPSHIDSLYRFAVLEGIPVICYGLRTDFLLQSFPASERLLALAHTLEELKTVCGCGKKAICNMRLVDGKPVFVGDQIAIDGDAVSYESVCGGCYAKYKQESARA